jgi:hypothetical protein
MDEDVWEYFLDMSKPLAECNAPLVERTATAAKRYSFGHFFDVICKHVRPYQTVGRVGPKHSKPGKAISFQISDSSLL